MLWIWTPLRFTNAPAIARGCGFCICCGKGRCVCHLQEVLQESQVKMSKHLGYLRRNGLIESERMANWTIYRLPAKANKLLTENLKCLQDAFAEDAVFRNDMKRLRKADTSAACRPAKSCC